MTPRAWASTAPTRSAQPSESHVTQLIAFALIAFAVVWGFRTAPGLSFSILYISALLLFTVAISARLFAAAWLTPFLSRLADPVDFPTYTILCPLYRKASHARAAPTMPFYWSLATIAAVRALWELLVRPHRWAKIPHGVSARASH